MVDENKLRILTEGAKYDVSCSSSGSNRKNSGGIGNGNYCGICHSFTSDGRCVSLLKLLMTNNCIFNCLYCMNRKSNDIERASLTPDEICELTMNFYKRNLIEGLFLSSAIENNSNATMELLTETVIKLRKIHNFHGYIHLKGIPHADNLLVQKAAAYVDRMSFNIELPSETSLKLLAPQKTKDSILLPMKNLSKIYIEEKNDRFLRNKIIPAGQTSQMIIGASPESDGQIIRLSEGMYNKFSLKRMYYSAYIPVNLNSSYLPALPTKLIREHRLYQADWLLRFYGFKAKELLNDDENFDENFDPKSTWAFKNMHLFPIEINSAAPEILLRIPGIGQRGVFKIVQSRKHTALTFEDLAKMRIVLKRAKHFITCKGKFFGSEKIESIKLQISSAEENSKYYQNSLFDSYDMQKSLILGEL